MHDLTYLAQSADPAHLDATLTYLAQRAGGQGGGSGIGFVDKAVNTIIRIIGAIIGVGFLWKAGLQGWGKGEGKKQGADAVVLILIGVGLMVLFYFIPNLISTGEGLLGDFL